MKRFIVLVVCLSICLSIFAFPVQASELESGNMVDMFEMVPIARGWDITSIHNYKTFSFPYYSYPVCYIDIVLQDTTGCLDGADWTLTVSTEAEAFWLTVLPLGHDLYRVYGYTGSTTKTAYIKLGLHLDFAPEAGFINFISFRYSELKYDSWDIEAYCDILAYAYGNQIHYVPTDEINHRSWLASDEAVDPFLQIDLYSEDWQKYDYIDYIVMLSCFSVTSITAFRDGVQVPISYSITDNSSTGEKTFTVLIRLDLRELDRTNSSLPNIHIEGQQLPGEYNLVGVVSCVGGILYDQQENSFQLLRVIRSYVVNLYNFLTQKSNDAAHFEDDVADQQDHINSIVDEMNSVTRPALDDVDGDVSDFVSTNDILLASTAFGGIFGSDIIVRICSMSLILCLASYVFFGKKG